MIKYTIDVLAKVTGGEIIARGKSTILDHLLLDSRKIIFPSGSVFFALKGPRRDGHQFIQELYERGVRNFVTSDRINTALIPGSNVLSVGNCLDALQALAAYHRSAFQLPVIGITGSNGKTIVKEWLNQLLEKKYRIIRSPKSYNSQTGVPLSVWAINAAHELGIFEAGISIPGEMERLEPIIKPGLGVFTSIGEAHSEGFNSLRQKIREKLKLFIHAEVLVYCSDQVELDEEVKALQQQRLLNKRPLELFDWGEKKAAKFWIRTVRTGDSGAHIIAEFKGREISISIPFSDEASVNNAITCWCVLLQLGMEDEYIAREIKYLVPVAMRLELKQGINDCSLINDSYSADLSSLNIALDFLQQQRQHSRRTVILSDILQSGRSPEELYSAVAHAMREKKVNCLIGIGPSISEHRELFENKGFETFFYGNTGDFLRDFHSNRFQHETILLKGARIFEFENISAFLEHQVHQTVLEIDLSAIAFNIKSYQQRLLPNTRIMAMVKAFSYGSGSFEIANLLQFHKVDYLAVAYADEGVELRKSGITLPIMVMNPEVTSFSAVVDFGLEPEIFSFGMLAAFLHFLKQEGITEYPVHVKLDTGMHRLGFEVKDVDRLVQALTVAAEVKVKTVFSHLVASEDPDSDEFTMQQGRQFMEACEKLEAALGYGFLKHLANTAAITRHPRLQLDMVRLGIGLYGISGSPDLLLREATTLKTTIAQIKHVKAGETVGYGRKAVLNKDSVIATIRLGYADGYPRKLGNGRGSVRIKEQLAPVVGNVCMDMTMVDITHIPGLKEGDEVLVFGRELSIVELAKWAETIPYEIMTGISRRVRRVYFEEA